MERNDHQTERHETFGQREFVASAWECTGLIPALTDADPDGELNEAYLYGIHAPKQRDGICEEETNGEHR